MIGVIADSAEREVVREFFELFKTPWEFYRRGRQYEALLCAGDGEFERETAKVVVIYAARKTAFDGRVEAGCQRSDACILSYQGDRIPLYGHSITFPEAVNSVLADEKSRQCVAYLDRSGETMLARIGYDLFAEVRTLLTAGQPEANAGMPALDLHIAFLRDLITGCGVPLVEIPPVPEGYQFIACLTHDVDHPSIRRHGWDHTTFGFLYRAVFGSLVKLVRGRLPVRDLLTNWMAAAKLPLVQLGWAKDIWREFGDQYLEVEQGLPSTFFVIPFENRPGRKSDGPAPPFRAARYGAQDIADTIQKLRTAGCEVALHGIDAWIDSSQGREELAEIRRLTGDAAIGVRMHWLYYDQKSPRTLENAGAVYDSTVGYNGMVGYRAGTTQVFQPLGASRLLELPLHVMDTALFYPYHLGLSPRQAWNRISAIVGNVVRLGGCFTVNWHDRSLAPERLWGACYRELVQDLKSRRAWFATASQTVAWFAKRRSAAFEMDSQAPEGVRVKVAGNNLPGLHLRIHEGRPGKHTDVALDRRLNTRVPCGAV
jgi:hypothetical protein